MLRRNGAQSLTRISSIQIGGQRVGRCHVFRLIGAMTPSGYKFLEIGKPS